MTTKPRRPLGERPVRVEVSEQLVKVRQQTLACGLRDVDGPLPSELFGDEKVSGGTTLRGSPALAVTPLDGRATPVVRIHAITG